MLSIYRYYYAYRFCDSPPSFARSKAAVAGIFDPNRATGTAAIGGPDVDSGGRVVSVGSKGCWSLVWASGRATVREVATQIAPGRSTAWIPDSWRAAHVRTTFAGGEEEDCTVASCTMSPGGHGASAAGTEANSVGTWERRYHTLY